MAENIFTGDLTKKDNWASVERIEHPQGIPASGEAVQKFIKSELAKKPGAFFAVDSTESSMLYGFEDSEALEAWKAGGSNPEDSLIISAVNISKSIPQPYYTVVLESKENNSTIISTDNTVKIKVKFDALYWEFKNGSLVSTSANIDVENCILTVQRLGNSGWEDKLNIDLDNINDVIEIDLTEVLSTGAQNVRLKVECSIKDQPYITSWVNYEVIKTNLNLSFATDWSLPQTGNEMRLSYFITGAVDKQLNLKITGVGGAGERLLTYNIGSKTYSDTPYTVSIKDNNIDNYKVITQGIHNIEAWVTSKIGGVVVAESPHYKTQILMITDASSAKPYVILNNLNTTLTNWADQLLFSYAVYHPTDTQMPVSFIIHDYNDIEKEYLNYSENAQVGVKIDYRNVIEVEGDDSELYANLTIKSNGVKLTDDIGVTIDNKEGFSPVENADFILNPKSRTNNVKDPKYIINSSNGEVINSTWTNFKFNRDGWVEDNNENKCLRVLAGQSLSIDYHPFTDWYNKSCTIEMVLATRNVVNEDVPVLRMCNYSAAGDPIGWELKPLIGAYMTPEEKVLLKQDVWIQEDTRTHIAINIRNQMPHVVDGKTYYANLVRIYVNGVLNREFSYGNDSDEATLEDTITSTIKRNIVIGDVNSGADIDVYSIRIYKRELSSSDILRNYISQLPTIDQKKTVRAANDILNDEGAIDYEKTTAKYNTLLWKYRASAPTESTRLATSGDDKDEKQKGDLVIKIHNADGTIDMDRSGVINDMTTKGQGTSSMTYWKWNQRWEFSKIKDENDKSIKSYFTPDNYKVGDSRKSAWQPAPGAPWAKRLDGKINWASPMQSHKIGSTGLYNDLWKEIIKDNEITKVGTDKGGASFTGTENGYKSCRVSVIQKPFLMFVQKDAESEPEFYGLYTMGPSKGDKPTFGYNSDEWPNFFMMEGCDNGAKLVNCSIPWNDRDIELPVEEDDGDMICEVFKYKGDKQWEISMGDTLESHVKPNGVLNPVLVKFKDLNNFCYKLNPNLKYFDGTYDGLAGKDDLDVDAFYWITDKGGDGSNKFNVYRCITTKSEDGKTISKEWVPAGVEYDGETYEHLNISDQTGFKPTSGSFEDWNNTFISLRTELFKQGIGEYVEVDDMRYSMQFLKLIAASDNWAKNTYIYNVGEMDDDGNVISKFRFFQDDLDTIFSLNNTGYKVKPYYVEEHDTDTSGANYWNASKNAFYCLAELAWPRELRQMMNSILKTMTNIGGSVLDCFDKYYGDITKYFPKVSYNEIAKLLYEDAYHNRKLQNYTSSVDPLAQSVGDQHEGERQWQRLRGIYLSSYAQYGEFAAADGSGGSGSIMFRSAVIPSSNGGSKSPTYSISLKPSMYLYPSMANGTSNVLPTESPDDIITTRKKLGEVATFNFSSDGNTNITLRGANYYSNIGDFGQVSTSNTEEFTLTGQRLEEFMVTGSNVVFRPNKLAISGEMSAMKKLHITGNVIDNTTIIEGGIDLSGMWKLEDVNLRSTSITSVTLPSNSNIHTLVLPKTIEKINLYNHKLLQNLTIAGYNNVSEVDINDCPSIDTLKIVNNIKDINSPHFNKLYINGFIWDDVEMDIINFILTVKNIKLVGAINISPSAKLDFNTKLALLNKFGNIDDPSNSLYITYTKGNINPQASIMGDTYLSIPGKTLTTHQYYIDMKEFTNANKDNVCNWFTGVEWSISDNDFATIDQTGLLTYINDDSILQNRSAIVSCTITTDEGTLTRTKDIYFNEKVAEVGDYVYYDGTLSEPENYNKYKTVVGVCYYVDGDDRRMMSLDLMAGGQTIPWGMSLETNGQVDNGGGNIYDPYIVLKYNASDPLKCGTIGLSSSSNYAVGQDVITLYAWQGVNSYYQNANDKTRDLSTNLTTEAYKDKNKYLLRIPTGTTMTCGGYNTINIIEHRNEKVLNKGVGAAQIPGTNINGDYVRNEWDYLNSILTEVGVDNKSDIKFTSLYPAASYCYAYEPKVQNGEELKDEYKIHNWYLPSESEAMYMWHCFADCENTLNKCSILINAGKWQKVDVGSSEQNGSIWTSCRQLYGSQTVSYLVQEASQSRSFNYSKNGSTGIGQFYMKICDNAATVLKVRACARF